MNRGVLNKVLMYGFIMFLGVVFADYMFPGVKVTVINDGQATLADPLLTVVDRPYRLESIPADGSAEIHTRKRGTGPVVLEYTDEKGERVKLISEARSFSGIGGTLLVHVKEGKIELEVAVKNEESK
jgi:hypothetical protein